MSNLDRVKNLTRMSMVAYDIFMDIIDRLDEEKTLLNAKESRELYEWQLTDRQSVKQLGKIQLRNEDLK